MRPRKPVEEVKRYRVSYVFTVTGDIDVNATSDLEARAIFAKWGTMTRLSRGGEWTVKTAGVEIISEDRYQAEIEQAKVRGQRYFMSLVAKRAAGRRLSLREEIMIAGGNPAAEIA